MSLGNRTTIVNILFASIKENVKMKFEIDWKIGKVQEIHEIGKIERIISSIFPINILFNPYFDS